MPVPVAVTAAAALANKFGSNLNGELDDDDEADDDEFVAV